MGWEQNLEREENKKVGEEVSVWSNGGVIRNHVTIKLYILIRDHSHTHTISSPSANEPRCLIIDVAYKSSTQLPPPVYMVFTYLADSKPLFCIQFSLLYNKPVIINTCLIINSAGNCLILMLHSNRNTISCLRNVVIIK